MFGSHLSIAGGLHNALIEAERMDMQCVQLFTQNQRQWSSRQLTRQTIEQWQQNRRDTALDRVVSHGSYLVNPASPDAVLRERSVRALRAELKRCGALGIDLLVIHPGAHVGSGEQVGLKRIAGVLNRLTRGLPDCRTVICLETTAGQGTGLGCRFEQLRWILDNVADPDRFGICLDTAHLLAAGYDLTSAAGARGVLDECEAMLGLDRVHVVHLNDSKNPLGSRVDRHEHIGRGHVALGAFACLVNHAHLRTIPKILETPKGVAEDGRPWDVINLEALQGLLE